VRRWLRWLWVSLIVLMVLAVAFIATVYATQGRWLPRAIVSATNAGRVIGVYDRTVPGVARQMRVEVGPPQAVLSVWVVDPAQGESLGVRGTVLVLHGVHDRKASMLGMGKRLAQEGYRAVLVDLRGHGESSGEWLTYGVVESRDLSQVLDALGREKLLVAPVSAVGISYGGATAIMLAGHDERVQAVVAVAPFCSMRDEVYNYIRYHRGIPRFVISDRQIEESIHAAGKLADFDPAAASPVDAIRRTKARVLIMHGEADSKIPFEHSRRLHAAAPDRSELIIVAGEDHDSLSCDRDGAVARETLTWLSRSEP